MIRFKKYLLESQITFDSIFKSNWEKLIKAYNEKNDFYVFTSLYPETNSRTLLTKLGLADHKNKYLQWIVKLYIHDPKFKLEDTGKVKESLELFDNNKVKLKQKDIYSYKSLDQLMNITDQFKGVKSVDKQIELEIKKGNIEVFYKDSKMTIYVPKTEDASCLLGAGTRWCTSSKFNNKFDYYNKQGPLYILFVKGEGKFQFHFPTKQFNNEQDKEIEYIKFFNNYNYLKDVFKKQIKDALMIEFIDNPSEALQLAAVERHGYAIQYIKNPSEALQLTAVNKNGYVIRYIKNPSEALQLAAVKQDRYAIRYIKNPSEAVQLAAKKG